MKKLFEHLREIVAVMNCVFDRNGMHVKVMDTKDILFVEFHFLKTEMESKNGHYACTPPSLILHFGVDLVQLNKVLKSAKDNCPFEMEWSGESLALRSINETAGRVSEHQMRPLEGLVTYDHMTIPRSGIFTAVCTLESAEYATTIREMSAAGSDSVRISVGKTLEFRASGDLTESIVTLEEHGDRVLKCTAPDAVSSSYTYNFLSFVAKSSRLSKQIMMMLASEAPLLCTYRLPNLGPLHYLLAPIIKRD